MRNEQDERVPAEEADPQGATDLKLDSTTEAKAEDGPEKANLGSNTNDASDNKEPNNGGEVERAWDHTSRKVIVHNVLKYIRPKEVKKIVNSWLEQASDPTSIRVHKVKKPPNKNWIQVTLETDDMVQPFLDTINSNSMTNQRGEQLFAKRASDERSNGDNKRKGSAEDTRRAKKQKQEQNEESRRLPKTPDQVRDAITPTWRESYEKQLRDKTREMIRKCALKIVQEVKGKFRTIEKEARKNKHRKVVEVYDWVNKNPAIQVKQILPSPQKLEYRNKCEFTFGYRHEVLKEDAAATIEKDNDETQQDEGENSKDVGGSDNIKKIPCVGFMASGWSGGVSRPHSCQNIPPEACAIADILDEFLQTSSIPPYDPRTHRGLWRTVAIRSSKRTGECMIVIVHAPAAGGAGAKEDGTDDYSETFSGEKKRLVDLLTNKDLGLPEREYPDQSSTSSDAGAIAMESDSNTTKASEDQTRPTRVISIFFQEYDGLSMPKPEHPVQHAFGKLALQERLGKCTFQISPGAFFQVNTQCAEVLYNVVVEKVREVATDPQKTLLFDVCCGTGTIGITCMKEGVVGCVVGVDVSQPAIADAKVNADLNGFSNADDEASSDGSTRFVASRAELVLAHELKQVKSLPDLSIVAVVDPAREGLHADVIKAIRGNERIQRLVYVSCNPTGTLVRDAGLLCCPPSKKYAGSPFRPTSAQPVDMFPLTSHCEMVMTFDRIKEPSDNSKS